MRVIRRSTFPLLLIFLAFSSVSGQNRCLTPDEAAKVVATINTPTGPNDAFKQVRKDLVDMYKEQSKLSQEILGDYAKNQPRVPELNRLGDANLLLLCEILKGNGWPPREALKDEGSMAMRYIIGNSRAAAMQRELFPVLIAASKKGDIGKPFIADLVDTIRWNSGYPQIFGTQATRRGDVVYILPLLNDEKVDEWRKEYELPPLAQQIRSLEAKLLLPVLKTQRLSSQTADARKTKTDVSALGISDDDADIKIETKIVNLNVRVFTRDFKTPFGVELTKDDFSIVENGVEQDIEFFSAESAPFDLVLLLDFSGSTADKRSLIKKAAKRFVEVAREGDRVSVIAFADDVRVVSELTANKAALYEAIDKIKTEGGSAVWDSLKYTYDTVLKTKSPGRRSALVFMTDGFDNASKSTYADVMEVVRHGDTTVFSVYVNSFDVKASQKDWFGRLVSRLQASLEMVADETGGQFYKAKDFKDLNGIYEQVVSDIGKIYSLGYESKNEERDGGWRPIIVKLKNKPDLAARTKHGYYAN